MQVIDKKTAGAIFFHPAEHPDKFFFVKVVTKQRAENYMWFRLEIYFFIVTNYEFSSGFPVNTFCDVYTIPINVDSRKSNCFILIKSGSLNCLKIVATATAYFADMQIFFFICEMGKTIQCTCMSSEIFVNE